MVMQQQQAKQAGGAAAAGRTLGDEALDMTPSRKDGISAEAEAEFRRKTCKLILTAARTLELPATAAETAFVFFHRFFAVQSFAKHDRFVMAIACVFLATKVEESSRKIDVVINACFYPWHGGIHIKPKSEDYRRLREKLLICERALLQTLAFSLNVDHIHRHLKSALKRALDPPEPQLGGRVRLPPPLALKPGDRKELATVAESIVNDVLRTSLCLRYPPAVIGACALFMAAAFLEVPGITMARLGLAGDSQARSVCEEMRDTYLPQPYEPGYSDHLSSQLRSQLLRRVSCLPAS